MIRCLIRYWNKSQDNMSHSFPMASLEGPHLSCTSLRSHSSSSTPLSMSISASWLGVLVSEIRGFTEIVRCSCMTSSGLGSSQVTCRLSWMGVGWYSTSLAAERHNVKSLICTKPENLSDCRLVLQLPLADPLKPGTCIKLRMKM